MINYCRSVIYLSMKNTLSLAWSLMLLSLAGCGLPQVIKPNTTGEPVITIPVIPGTPTVDPPSNTVTGEYYFKGSVDGKTVNWSTSATAKGWTEGWANSSSRGTEDVTGSMGGTLSEMPSFKHQLTVEFKTIQILYTANKSAVFKNFVKLGAWNFATDDSKVINTKFLSIHYSDANEKHYSTLGGSQTGSVSNILSATPIPASLGTEEGLKVKLTFNCKLYPVDSGNQPMAGQPITITNGEATIRLTNSL